MNLFLIFAIYLLAGFIGLRFPRIAYGVMAIGAGLTLFLLIHMKNMEAVEWYFIFLSSLAWLIITLFSLGYEREDKILSSAMGFTTAFMLLIMLAHDAITFLIGWEGMTVASFLSLYSRKKSRNAAYLFIAFGELSFLFILAGFAIASFRYDGLLFSNWGGNSWDMIYSLVAVGFLIKMAAVPAHIWLPEAHSRAPANMSAQLSAVMTLMGLYGLVKFSTIAVPGMWIGVSLLIIGGVSALIGVFYAAVCDHVKKLPAYSTVENDGVIIAITGAFIVTFAQGDHIVAAFMLMSALFFAFAHTIAKSLLFMVAGKLEKSGGEFLGGKFRLTHIGALAGYLSAISLAGVPPLPGFVAEWTALESLFQSFYFSNTWLRVLVVSTGALVALTAGLSTIVMSKFIVHGVDRSEKNKPEISDAGLIIGAGILFFAGVLPQFVFCVISPILVLTTGVSAAKFSGGLFGIPDGYLIISGKGFGVLSPTILFIILSVVFLTVYGLMHLTIKNKRTVKAWSGGLSNEEYPTRAHSSILLLTQKWLFGTKNNLEYRDAVKSGYFAMARSFAGFSRAFQRVLMPGNDRRYVLYIIIALLIYLLIALF